MSSPRRTHNDLPDDGLMKRSFAFMAGALLALAPALTACGGHRTAAPPATPTMAQEMSGLLETMDGLGQIRFPMARPGSVLPAEMNRPMSWHWSGRLDDGVRLLAGRVGYSVITPPAAHAITVRVDDDNTTAGRLFDHLAASADPRAEIDIDVPRHTIRIICHV